MDRDVLGGGFDIFRGRYRPLQKASELYRTQQSRCTITRCLFVPLLVLTLSSTGRKELLSIQRLQASLMWHVDRSRAGS